MREKMGRAVWVLYLVAFLVFAFILAGVTESILERSWGISFYLLVVMIVWSHKLSTDASN